MTPINLLTATSDLAVKGIRLTQGQFGLVDAADYPRLSQFNWHADWAKTTESYYDFGLISRAFSTNYAPESSPTYAPDS